MRRALPVVVLLALAGCKKTLHWANVEDDLALLFQPKLDRGERIDVHCPETEVKVGLSFRCHVTTGAHGAADVQITLRDLAGGYAYEVLR